MDKTFKIKRCAVRLNRVNTALLQQIVQELKHIETPRIRNCVVRLNRCYLPAAVAENGGAYIHVQRTGARSEKSVTPTNAFNRRVTY